MERESETGGIGVWGTACGPRAKREEHRLKSVPQGDATGTALTWGVRMLRLGTMEVHLKPELQARVERAAAENESGPAGYVQQLVEN